MRKEFTGFRDVYSQVVETTPGETSVAVTFVGVPGATLGADGVVI
jgi:hypothetical protein